MKSFIYFIVYLFIFLKKALTQGQADVTAVENCSLLLWYIELVSSLNATLWDVFIYEITKAVIHASRRASDFIQGSSVMSDPWLFCTRNCLEDEQLPYC